MFNNFGYVKTECPLLRQATTVAGRFIEGFLSSHVDERQREKFLIAIIELMRCRFMRHWYPDNPVRGQAYRCIRINSQNRKDSFIDTALTIAGLTYKDINLPIELTMWVDPDEVVCRYGENGSFQTMACFRTEETNDVERESNSTSTTPSPPRTPSPIPNVNAQPFQPSNVTTHPVVTNCKLTIPRPAARPTFRWISRQTMPPFHYMYL